MTKLRHRKDPGNERPVLLSDGPSATFSREFLHRNQKLIKQFEFEPTSALDDCVSV